MQDGRHEVMRSARAFTHDKVGIRDDDRLLAAQQPNGVYVQRGAPLHFGGANLQPEGKASFC
jgi:hypothetical protein